MTPHTETLMEAPTKRLIRKPRVRRWHVILAATVIVSVLAIGLSTRRERVKVQVIAPHYQDLESTVSTIGTVVPLDEFPARANFSGMVEDINVQLGEKVHPGQLLVTMKDQYALSRLDQAKATLDAAEVSEHNVANNGSQEDRISFAADLAKARMEQKTAAAALSSMKQLLPKGSVSQAEVDAAEQRLAAANTTLESLQQRDKDRYSAEDLKSWKDKVAAAKAALDAEKVSYGNAYVTSPIAGTVYVIPIARYDFVPAGADLLRVADLRHIQIHADFDEPDVAKLHNGEAVKINWEGRPGHTWHGHVLHAPMAVTGAGPRNVGMCTIAVDDATGDLPADSHVTVNVTTGTRHHVLTVPREALHTDGPERFVYRVSGGKVVRTPVTEGLVDLFRAEITSGLKEGDLVIMHSAHGEELSEGLNVETVR